MIESLQVNSILFEELFYFSCSVISSMDEIFPRFFRWWVGVLYTKLFKSSTEVQIVVTGWELKNCPVSILVFMYDNMYAYTILCMHIY
jgi:hypothetical protein